MGGAAFQSVWPGFNTLSFLARPRGRPSAPRTLTDILGRRSDYAPPFFFKDFIYLFLERGERKKKEREQNIDWLPLTHAPQLGT